MPPPQRSHLHAMPEPTRLSGGPAIALAHPAAASGAPPWGHGPAAPNPNGQPVHFHGYSGGLPVVSCYPAGLPLDFSHRSMPI